MGAMGTHFDVVKQLLENAPTPVSTDSCAACGTKLGVQSLNIKATYARNWKAGQGIRELLQNFFDKVGVGWESRLFCACVCMVVVAAAVVVMMRAPVNHRDNVIRQTWIAATRHTSKSARKSLWATLKVTSLQSSSGQRNAIC